MPSNTPDPGGEGGRDTVEVGLGLGSNIGDGPGNIARALRLLAGSGAIEITAVSSIYKTAPWGYLDQPPFANACALARTRLDPTQLLAAVKKVEADMGRRKTVRWGPRLIDIDILFYGDMPLATPELVLPHKELFNRAFVLVPLAEIAPQLRIGGRSVADAAAKLVDAGIERWANG
ncbi:MAG: 2-amino-4-hydroxy-6-hydroxymethyldihydropteridine diphosphokinase [Methylovirgula sp.]